MVSGFGFQPIARRSLPESIAEQLSRRLEAGEFGAGQRLPGHRQLASGFGVSLPVVREALSRLVAWGWLEIRPGDGTFVCPYPGRSTNRGSFEVEASSHADLLDIVEARMVLEVTLGGLCGRTSRRLTSRHPAATRRPHAVRAIGSRGVPRS